MKPPALQDHTPQTWWLTALNHARRLVVSSEPRGSVRRVVGIGVAVALTLLMFVAVATLQPRLLADGRVLLGFIACLFVVSVVAGYYVSGLSIRRAAAD